MKVGVAVFSRVTDTPFFEGISDLDVPWVNELFTFNRLVAGQTLFYQGEVAESLCIVHSGTFQKSFNSETRSLVLAYHRAGDLMGEAEVMHSRRVRYVHTVAIEDSAVWHVKKSKLDILLQRHPILYQRMFDAIGERFIRAGRKITYLAFLDARMRIIQLLLDYAQDKKSESLDGSVFEWQITQQELGELVGLNRESVARAITDLSSLGVIESGRGYVKLTNLTKLLELAYITPSTMLVD